MEPSIHMQPNKVDIMHTCLYIFKNTLCSIIEMLKTLVTVVYLHAHDINFVQIQIIYLLKNKINL